MLIALIVALLAVGVLGVWLWMDARQRRRKREAYEAWLLERAYEEPFDTVLPATGRAPSAVPTQGMPVGDVGSLPPFPVGIPESELPKAEGLYGYFDDTTGSSHVTRADSFRIGKLPDYYHGDDSDEEAATEIFSAHASGELMDLMGEEDSGPA